MAEQLKLRRLQTFEVIDSIDVLEKSFFGAEAWSEEQVRQYVEHAGICFLVQNEVQVIGYLLGTYSPYTLVADIDKLAVLPQWRRNGIAQQLLLAFVERVTQLGAERIMLEVRLQNTTAQAFYLRNGFIVIHKRKDYY